jgi:hypothetical protein
MSGIIFTIYQVYEETDQKGPDKTTRSIAARTEDNDAPGHLVED